jgi:hypothetical protein
MRVKYTESCGVAGWGGEGGERGREGWRGEIEVEKQRVFVCFTANPRITASLGLTITLLYVTFQRGHTQRSSSLIPAMTCPPSVSLYQLTRGEDNRRRRREGHQEGQPLIDNASRLVTSHTPTYLITSPGKHTHLVNVVPTSLSEVPSKKRGESSGTACTLPSRSSCHIYHIAPCSRYPRVSLLQRCA